MKNHNQTNRALAGMALASFGLANKVQAGWPRQLKQAG
jgi:hypothetical protein